MIPDAFERALALIRGVGELQHHEALTVSTMTQTQASALRAVLAPVATAPEVAGAAGSGGGAGGAGGSAGGSAVNEVLLPLVLKELSRYASLGCNPPPPPTPDPSTAARSGTRVRKARTGACQALALAAMDELSTLYVNPPTHLCKHHMDSLHLLHDCL